MTRYRITWKPGLYEIEPTERCGAGTYATKTAAENALKELLSATAKDVESGGFQSARAKASKAAEARQRMIDNDRVKRSYRIKGRK